MEGSWGGDILAGIESMASGELERGERRGVEKRAFLLFSLLLNGGGREMKQERRLMRRDDEESLLRFVVCIVLCCRAMIPADLALLLLPLCPHPIPRIPNEGEDVIKTCYV
jgi:hypothetical protein